MNLIIACPRCRREISAQSDAVTCQCCFCNHLFAINPYAAPMVAESAEPLPPPVQRRVAKNNFARWSMRICFVALLAIVVKLIYIPAATESDKLRSLAIKHANVALRQYHYDRLSSDCRIEKISEANIVKIIGHAKARTDETSNVIVAFRVVEFDFASEWELFAIRAGKHLLYLNPKSLDLDL